ncbi:unnamed protein product [Meganyctiphanes norvegica]|uniref:Uncharacterized protein n=1 Tax=Meganyctiphanes norvegica TaxID=48144 RepID=A0AAV2QKB6_MEGNR
MNRQLISLFLSLVFGVLLPLCLLTLVCVIVMCCCSGNNKKKGILKKKNMIVDKDMELMPFMGPMTSTPKKVMVLPRNFVGSPKKDLETLNEDIEASFHVKSTEKEEKRLFIENIDDIVAIEPTQELNTPANPLKSQALLMTPNYTPPTPIVANNDTPAFTPPTPLHQTQGLNGACKVSQTPNAKSSIGGFQRTFWKQKGLRWMQLNANET